MIQDCYLCSKPIARGTASGDHVVPKQLIRRIQAKVKGFDYAGVLPSHKKCNNEFGPECMNRKALVLLSALHNEDCFGIHTHRHNSEIELLALNSKCLPGFTRQDLEFFKIIDVREAKYTEWSAPAFFSDKQKTDPLKQALDVALAVLTKSVAALLISRHLKAIPTQWRIVAMPYFDKSSSVDFDDLLGDTRPFDVGLKVWIRRMEKGDWFAIYKARDILLYFHFWFSQDRGQLEEIGRIFSDAERFLFEGEKIMDIVGYQWIKIQGFEA